MKSVGSVSAEPHQKGNVDILHIFIIYYMCTIQVCTYISCRRHSSSSSSKNEDSSPTRKKEKCEVEGSSVSKKEKSIDCKVNGSFLFFFS